MKSRPDPALDIRSVHEAGHAIAAVEASTAAFSRLGSWTAKNRRRS
jgi:hypothetical protein